MVVQEIECNKENDTCISKYSVRILANNDGNVIKKIPLHSKEVYALCISNDGSSFVIVTKKETDENPGKRYLSIEKYSFSEDKWVWEDSLNTIAIGLKITFNSNDKELILITSENTIIIDQSNGAIIKKDSTFLSTFDYNLEFSKINLSTNGKYFAFWKRKYFTFSKYDEVGLSSFADALWYSIKWIGYLGSIPNYIYIWDIYGNKLYDKIEIPFEIKQGTPAFTDDEKSLLIGPIKNEYLVYSLAKKKIIRDFFQADTILIEQKLNSPAKDYKVISPNKKFFVSCINDKDIFLLNYESGELISKFKQDYGSLPFSEYAVSFSKYNIYMSLVIAEGQIILYDTGNWQPVWIKKL